MVLERNPSHRLNISTAVLLPCDSVTAEVAFTLSVSSQRNGGLFGNHLMNGGHPSSNGHQTNATQRPLQVQPPPHYAHMEEPVGRLSRANAMSQPNHHRHHHHHHNRHHNSYNKSPKSTNINLNNANVSSLPNGGHHCYYDHAPPNGYPGLRNTSHDYDKSRTPQSQRYENRSSGPDVSDQVCFLVFFYLY